MDTETLVRITKFVWFLEEWLPRLFLMLTVLFLIGTALFVWDAHDRRIRRRMRHRKHCRNRRRKRRRIPEKLKDVLAQLHGREDNTTGSTGDILTQTIVNITTDTKEDNTTDTKEDDNNA